MLCEEYRSAISAALAADADNPRLLLAPTKEGTRAPLATAQPPLSEHLAACAACRSFYAEEQKLFAAIDAGLSHIANVEPSPAFLSRVRTAAELENSAASARQSMPWFAWWQVAAVAAGVCLVLIVSLSIPSKSVNEQMPATVTHPNDIQNGLAGTQQSAASGNGPEKNNIRRKVSRAAGRPQIFAQAAKREDPFPMAAVLVPPDEREALARFVDGLRQQQQLAVALAQPAAVAAAPGMGAEPIEIAALKLPPLLRLIALEPTEAE